MPRATGSGARRFIWEMMRPLLRGATTVVIPDDVIYDPKALIRFLEEYGITETLVTPSLLEAVLNSSGPDVGERLSKLKTLWLNGEVVPARSRGAPWGCCQMRACSTSTVAARPTRWPPGTCASWSRTLSPRTAPSEFPWTRSTSIYSTNGERVPEGEAGELFVGGDCLARGYVDLPEKTEELPEDPFFQDRSKDVPHGRQGPHPLRWEPGDPRPRGLYGQDPGLQRRARRRRGRHREGLAVTLRRGLGGRGGEDKRLVAYIVPDPEDNERYSGWSLDPKTGRSKEIRSILQDSLPHYAVPSVFVELSRSPSATSGKIDRSEPPPPPPRPPRRDTGARQAP